MSENNQINPDVIGNKQGIPVYKTNPSVPNANDISRRKRIKYGDEKKGFVVDTGTGEVIGVGGMGFYQFEEVDDTRFVKMFLSGIKQTAGLSKAGLSLFEIVYCQLQENPGQDEIKLSHYSASQKIKDLNERTYRRGLRELLDKQFLFRSPSDGVFFVNICYMFNGDRLAFVKGYQRKGTGKQAELPLENARQQTLSLHDDA
jgi:hypothetical protein